MRVLGLDPSTVATGWAVIHGDSRAARAVEWGVLRPGARRAMPERLRVIHDGLAEVLRRLPVEVVVLESAFLHRNARTALALGEVRGVVLLASECAGVRVHEYSAAEIKRAAVGYGAADKEQVSRMMARLLGLQGLDEPDAADALAAAWCHLSRAARPVAAGVLP